MQQNAEFFRMPSQTPFLIRKGKVSYDSLHIYICGIPPKKVKEKSHNIFHPNLVCIYASINGYVLKLTEAHVLPLPYLITSPQTSDKEYSR